MALDRIKWCLDQGAGHGHWPRYSLWDKNLGGYVEGPQNVGLPDYYRKRLMDQDELEDMPEVKINEVLGLDRPTAE